jgi:glycosyltransferase involved in cell wall biosynthesis
MIPYTESSVVAEHPPRIAAIVPCFRVRDHVLDVLARIGPECNCIYVVDDACPERTGDHVQRFCTDPRVRVLRHAENQGVGGAVITGYRAAIADGCDVLVKIDGDGQMDPALLPAICGPVVTGQADYAKGNRFYDLANIRRMPTARILGNVGLSFLTKLSAGYWDIFDPTNGYTAIHAAVARQLPLGKVSRRYFFETDMLFRLNTVRAVVVDVPMDARYGDESSSLRVTRALGEFLVKNVRNTVKRIFYNYFLRDFSVATLELVVGLALLTFGSVVGIDAWLTSARTGTPTLPGTVMLAGLPILAGLQLVLAFIGFDIASVPRRPLHRVLVRHPGVQTHTDALDVTAPQRAASSARESAAVDSPEGR